MQAAHRELDTRDMRFLERRRRVSSETTLLNGFAATLLHGVMPNASALWHFVDEPRAMAEVPAALIEDFQGLIAAQRGNAPYKESVPQRSGSAGARSLRRAAPPRGGG